MKSERLPTLIISLCICLGRVSNWYLLDSALNQLNQSEEDCSQSESKLIASVWKPFSVVHLYRDGIRRGVAFGLEKFEKSQPETHQGSMDLNGPLNSCVSKILKYRSEPIPYAAYIFYITTYTFSVEVLLKLHQSTINEKTMNEIILP